LLPFTKLVPFTVIFGVPLITVLVELLTMAFAEPLIGALVELLTVPFGEPLTVPDLARPPPLVLLNSVVGTIFVAWPLVPYFARNFGVLLTKNFSFFDAPYLGSFTLEIDAEKLRSGTIIAMSMTNQKPRGGTTAFRWQSSSPATRTGPTQSTRRRAQNHGWCTRRRQAEHGRRHGGGADRRQGIETSV